jgi:hypothetical protein
MKSVTETLKEIINRWGNDKFAGENTWQQNTTAIVAGMTTHLYGGRSNALTAINILLEIKI